MGTVEEKEKLRTELLKRRLQLDEKIYLRKSTEIITRLKSQPEYKTAQIIHCYVSLNKRNEVNTLPFIKELLAGDKKLVVPVTNFEDNTLAHIYLDSFNDLKENKWGVLEPEIGEGVDPQNLDVVIVPMAGGDYQKNRMGYGKGFYDRFLSEVNCPKMGLLFEDCLVDKVPTEKFDVPLSKLVTESQIIS